MKRFSLKRGITFSILVFVILFMPAFGITKGLSISYDLSLAHPENHLFQVTLKIENNRARTIDVTLPAWSPGTYTLQDHARNLLQFKAETGDGTPLPATREDFDTWRVRANHHATVIIHYKILGLLHDDGACYLGADRAYVNGASVFMYVEGEKNRPATLTVRDLPADWDIATGLTSLPEPNRFSARNYDELIDCPLLMGKLDWFSFKVAGIPHYLAIWNLKNSNMPVQRVLKVFQGFVQQVYRMFGELDYTKYVFLIQLYNNFDALEHRNSCTLSFYPYKFDDPLQFDDFTWVGFHEYFHNFNVKRIRPDVLGPFDYKHPVYTKRLWISEGLTDYFPDVLFQRDGFWSKARLYRQLGEEISLFETLPARHWMSLESSSIQFWHLSDNKLNLEISYYNKGEIVGWMLDLELLHRTGGKHNLADVMRYLYRHYYKRGVGFSEKRGIQRDVEAVAGGSFQNFFDRYVRGTADIPYQKFLNYAGLKLAASPDTLPYTGIQTFPRKSISRVYATEQELHNSLDSITNVVMGSPAWKAGISKGDIILAVNGFRVSDGEWERIVNQTPVDSSVTFLLQREDKVITKIVRLTKSPFKTYSIVEDENATPEQIRLREIWLRGKPH
ncbi:MAG: M61 family metallopeptidase [Calditrichaeota bacterium]|nr:M61 family metallopeptidase [Calditrichota bacterium]